MQRCLQLAQLGAGYVAPNPMVGAVLVQEERIIGEGYHRQYGGPHAEPNCIHSVKEEDRSLIEASTLYVSLEPCAHFGKTPPCADLIIEKKIPKVVIGCRDPFVQVNGKGIEKLRAAGIEVEVGILQKECTELNKRFFSFHAKHRPYVVLKWAQTLDGKVATSAGAPMQSSDNRTTNDGSLAGARSSNLKPSAAASRLFISNEYSNRIVHKWRSEEASILVGTNTALLDDPSLTTRLWKGKDPVRLVIDMDLKLPASLKLFQSKTPTVVFNTLQHNLPADKISRAQLQEMRLGYYQVTEDVSLVHQLMNALYAMNIQSVLVEGGSYLLQSFIDEGNWDEARVITNEQLRIGQGLSAPALSDAKLESSQAIFTDMVRTYKNTKRD